ncbi:hypothetical protein ACB098_12G067100 [Castanea mollissima]
MAAASFSNRINTAIGSIMIYKYPSISEGRTNETVGYEMDLVDSAVKSLRSLVNERRERKPASVLRGNKAFAKIIGSHQWEIITLANLST